MRLEELRRLADQRTGGRWRSPTKPGEYFGDSLITLEDTYEGWRDDVAFIAAMANHAHAMLDALDLADALGDRMPLEIAVALDKLEEIEG